jgi:hypothetical protein
MTQGRKELRSIRIKKEAVPGTLVAPRFLWRGNGDMLEDMREVVQVEEQIGVFGGSDRTYISKLAGGLSLAETEMTFEQPMDLFYMAGLGTTSTAPYQGTVLGGGTFRSVLQEAVVPTQQTFPLASYTIEAGDNVESEVMPYALATSVSITGAGGEPLMISGELTGRYVDITNAQGTFSAIGTIPSVETILASNGTVWMMDLPSGQGTGQVVAGNVLAFEMEVESRYTWKYPVDSGTIYPHVAVFTGIDISGQLTFEHQISGTQGGAGSAGQKIKWRNEIPQMLQMRFAGGTILSGTAGYVNKVFEFVLPIKFESFDPLDDMDGNNIYVASWTSRYNVDTPALGRGTFRMLRSGTSEFSGA